MMMLAGLLLAMTIQPAPVAEIVVRDMMSNVEDPKQVASQTDAEWAALWKLHAGDKALPKVDLKTRTVVAVALPTRRLTREPRSAPIPARASSGQAPWPGIGGPPALRSRASTREAAPRRPAKPAMWPPPGRWPYGPG